MDKKLIVVVVNRGFAEFVVEQSRIYGAKGATILHGRGTAHIGESFMGMEITPEKEVVLIIAESAVAKDTQQKLDEQFAQNTAAGGICFVLPVSHLTNKGNT